MDVPVPPFQEGIEELIKLSSAERISKRTVEQIVDWPVPQIEEQIAEVAKTTTRRHGCRHACCDAPTGPSGSDCASDGGSPAGAVRRHSRGRAVDQPGDQAIQEQIVEVAETIPQERFSERAVAHNEDASVPQILKEVVEVVKAVKTAPQERFPAKICEQIVDTPVPQAVDEPEPVPSIQEEIDEVIKLFPEEHTPRRIQGVSPQERISERIHDQTVDQPGDQTRRDTADSITSTKLSICRW